MFHIDAMHTSNTAKPKYAGNIGEAYEHLALKGHTNNSHGFQPMEPASQQQIRTPKGSTN